MRRLIVPLLLLSSVLASAPLARAEIVERIIVKVNGDIITLSEFNDRQIAAAQAARVTPDGIATFLRENNARLLQEAIDDVLLIQRAVDGGMGLRPEFIDEIVESVKKDNGIESEEQFQAALAGEGLTLDDLRENIEKSWTKRMIIQREVEPLINLTEDQLKEEYERMKDTAFTKAATVTLQVIFIPVESGGITLARDIVARARAGADFASMARTHSAGPTADSGGDLGEIRQGDLSPDLDEAAFSLPVGSVSDPIASEDGFRILRVVAKTTGSVVPYATAKARVRSELMPETGEEVDDSRRQPGLFEEEVTVIRGQHLGFRRFPQHGVAHEGRGQWQISGDRGEVERRNRGDKPFERAIVEPVPGGWV